MVLHLGGDTYVGARDILAVVGTGPQGCVVYAFAGGELRAHPTALSLRAIGRRVRAMDEETRRIQRIKR